MTARETGLRRPVIPAHEMRRLGEYPRPSHLTEEELAQGYGVRLRMLGVEGGPACRLKQSKGRCPCGGHDE